MGLGLGVGVLADLRANDADGYAERLEQFAAVNEALHAAGLPAHHEPYDLGGREPWFGSIGGYGALHDLRRIAAYLWGGYGLPEPDTERPYHDYGALHHLRRIAAHVRAGHSLPPPNPERPSHDPIMDACYARSFSDASPYRAEHLIFHCDAEGLYLPLAFRAVIEPPEELSIVGGPLGSSYTLLEECQRIATVLALPLDRALVWEGEADWTPPTASRGDSAPWRMYLTAARTCGLLYNACRVSIAMGCAITFG